MSLETYGVKISQEIVNKGVKLTETTIKKAWSIMDAASQKEAPSKILGPKAINSIQGHFTN